MQSMTISINWYNEIKDRVPHGEPYIYQELGHTNVEVDVDEDIFLRTSKELGWM